MPRLMIRPRPLVLFSALAAALLDFVLAGASQAQTPPARPAQAAPAQPPPAAGKAAPAAKSNATQTAANEAALRQRVEQLEEQLIDLQVIIGTLESLARPPATAASTDRASGDATRIQALEAQLKSLSSQIEQLGEKVRGAGEPTRRSEVGPVPQSAPPAATPRPPSPPAGQQQLPPAGTNSTSVGSATVTSSRPETGAPPAAEQTPPKGQDLAAVDTAAQPADEGQSKQDYELAYSFVIQRDYGAAQAGFTEFLKHYPKDPLVPNALYWLGETHYQQRNFADAAEAFDLVTALHASSPKAPDSQLKRALSLSALGKTSEACAALHDLDTKFQNAPAYVKTRAGTERRRLGCI